MVDYGLAFVLGWTANKVCTFVLNKTVDPISIGGVIWGLIFMVLNWIATLG